MSPVVEALKTQYGDELQVVYRHLPLISIHDKAVLSAEAAEAAGAQGLFWEMHDILYQEQQTWSSLTEPVALETFIEYAAEIGVADMAQFRADLEGRTYEAKVMRDYQAAVDAGLRSTPSFVINGVDYPADAFGLSPQGLTTFIDLMGLRSTDLWFDAPEQVIDPSQDYIATIETEKGEIVVELYPDTAPTNVNSFAFLAEQGWYVDTTFHRVLPDFVAQGGDPTDSGVGFPGYQCEDEVVESRQFDSPGIVSLANSGPNTNGGQFFITFQPTPNLNENFTIIGQVIEGFEVVESLSPRDPQVNVAAPAGDRIIDITVEERE